MLTSLAIGVALLSVCVVIFPFLPGTSRSLRRSFSRPRVFSDGLIFIGVLSGGLAILGAFTSSLMMVMVATFALIVGLIVAVAAPVHTKIVPKTANPVQNILIIAAHPDDLEIACGATVAKLVDQGHNVRALIMADGGDGGEISSRLTEANDGAKFLGLAGLTMLELPDRELELNMKRMIAAAEDEIREVQPSVIFTHSANDVHQDHVAVHQAVVRAARNHHSILCFESPSVTADFKPTVFIDVDGYLSVKREAIAAHASQSKKPYMTSDVIDSTLKFRGRQGRIPRAEGFEAVRFHLTDPAALSR